MFTSQKIFSGLLSAIIVLFLLYTSYLFTKTISDSKEIKIKDISKKEYIIQKNKQKFQVIPKEKQKNDLVINYLDYTNKIISYKATKKIKDKKIELEKGVFLIDIGMNSSRYEFRGNGFSIKDIGTTSFYIDNSGEKTKIVSLNNLLTIDLINPEDEKKINTVYLYPNEYIIFESKKNKFLKDVDIFRISQITSLDFINSPIIKNGKITDIWVNKVFSGNEEEKQKLGDMFFYLVEEKEKEKRIFEIFKDEGIINISSINLIEKFFSLFLNPEKKKIYYKNIILRDLLNIVNFDLDIEKSKNKDLVKAKKENNVKLDKKKKLINEKIENIKINLDNLKKLSKKDYEEMKKINLYYLSLFIQGSFDKEKNIVINKFINDLKGEKIEISKNNKLKLAEIFKDYNYHQKQDIYKNMGEFVTDHIEFETEDEKGYFTYYLRKFILKAFEDLKQGIDIKLENLINLVSSYTDTSLKYYKEKITNSGEKEKKIIIETSIKTYNEVLRLLTRRIGKSYFYLDVDKGILIKKVNSPKITKQELYKLKLNIEKINKFIENENNQKSLKDSVLNKIIMTEHFSIKETLDIYFKALNDYESYLAEYDKKNKDFLSNKSVVNNGIKLERQYLIDYLSQFDNINFENIKVKARSRKYCYEPNLGKDSEEDSYCYDIKNLIVNGEKKLDFLLFPYENNKIQNIVVDDNPKNNEGSYPLNLIKENFDSYALRLDDSGEYEFKDFFYLVFISSASYKAKETFEFSVTEDEKPFIRAVKNSLLLGKGGSLKNLESYLDIKYKNIVLTEKEKEKYEIEIVNVPLNYAEYQGEFNSEYLFKNGETNSFKNPKVKFTDLLKGNNINFIGIFAIDGKDRKASFEKVLYKLTKKGSDNKVDLLTKIDNLITDLSDITGESQFRIVYNYITNSFTIKGESIYVATKGFDLIKIVSNGKNILTKSDKIDNLIKYFNN